MWDDKTPRFSRAWMEDAERELRPGIDWKRVKWVVFWLVIVPLAVMFTWR